MYQNLKQMKKKYNLELVATIIIICLAFFLGKDCSSKKEIQVLKPLIETIHTTDTVFAKDTFITYVYKPKFITKYDTVFIPLDSVNCDKVIDYTDTIKSAEYEIINTGIVQGVLRQLETKVKLKVPLIIRDSVFVTKDTTVYKPNTFNAYLGLVTSFKTLSPVLDLNYKDMSYTLGYDILNKNAIIGIKYRIFKSTK
jgi:hypothetical protein